MNANDIVFGCSLQLMVLGLEGFMDRVNLVVMYLMLFVVVLYSLGCYCFIYTTQNRRSAKTLIVYLDSRYMFSYFFEPTLIIIRSLTKTFVNGYLIQFYSTQIVCLLVIDVVFFIVVSILNRKF